eukprot:7205750-Lingulodinium_polyedra.AAC.1
MEVTLGEELDGAHQLRKRTLFRDTVHLPSLCTWPICITCRGDDCSMLPLMRALTFVQMLQNCTSTAP